MSHSRAKLVVAGLAIGLAGLVLALSGVREGWVYYLPVDEYVGDDGYRLQRVRLHGDVGDEELQVSPGLLLASFDLLGEQHRVRVEYNGVVPDQFQVGREVVVEGRLDEAGVFQADTLLTKCASKYEARDGEAPHADPRRAETSG